MLPPAGSSVFLGGFVVSQGIPHCGHIIPFLGHVFSSSFLLGLPVLPGLNEVIVTSLPLNYGGCCPAFPTRKGSPSGHLAASLPDGPGAWIFEVWWIPETFLLCPSLDGVPRPCPWPHAGRGQRAGRSTHAWHTLTRLWSASLPPAPPEYKKKYGEEHGSCQAGIAGFFTEVGIAVWAALLSWVFISWLMGVWGALRGGSSDPPTPPGPILDLCVNSGPYIQGSMLPLVGAPAGQRPLGRGGELAHLDPHLDSFSRSQFDPETYGRN